MATVSPTCRDTAPVSVGIPSYNRCEEMAELFESIYTQNVLPQEITVCEDNSPQREQIRAIADAWKPRFAAKSCTLNYLENECNLGYDGNVRRVIAVSHAPWVMLMGNDDLLLPGCLETISAYTAVNPTVPLVSRSFVMFEGSLAARLGTSRLSPTDRVFRAGADPAGMIMRTCGFVGGLVINRDWAIGLSTDRYDGSLYYQIYLAAVAFSEAGIGYISRPIVASRAGNPPLFGASAAEQAVHVPGSYTPKGRAAMWAAILRIVDDVGRRFGIDLKTEMKVELEVRQAFHIFEMMAGAGRQSLSELRREFARLGLFSHPLPRTLYAVDMLLGSRAKIFYRAVRAVRGVLTGLRAQTAPRAAKPALENS